MQVTAHRRATYLDPTDIPVVPAGALQAIVDLIVDRGEALVLFRGAPPATRNAIEQAFWQDYSGERMSGDAALVRFWHLVDAMAARRLKSLFLERGYAAIAPLAACAATSRLNIHWGFKPQHLVAALLTNACPAPNRSSQRLAA